MNFRANPLAGEGGSTLRRLFYVLIALLGIAVVVVLGTRFMRAPRTNPPVAANYGHDDPASVKPVSIPDPAPIPDLDRRPPSSPLPVYLVTDPFPPAPPKKTTPSRTIVTRPRPAAPPLPRPNELALFVKAKGVKYVGFTGGINGVGTFRYGNLYLVMSPGDFFPSSKVRVQSIRPDYAIVSDGAHQVRLSNQ